MNIGVLTREIHNLYLSMINKKCKFYFLANEFAHSVISKFADKGNSNTQEVSGYDTWTED